MTILAPFFLVAAFLTVRLLPIWPNRFQGCDAYNILMNAEIFRRDRRLPIRMPPIFMLETEDQWYPPGFLMLCAALPPEWLARRYWLVNHLIDAVSAVMIYAVAVSFGAAPVLALAAGLAYGLAPGLVSEFSALNVRPFGLLLFNIVLFSAIAAGPHAGLWPLAAFFATLLFFSHKLSVQMLWALLPVLAVATGAWSWLVLLIALYAIPFVIWPRGAWRIVRGHFNIVRFWTRNWPVLGAHMVRQSPVYGDGTTRNDVYANEGVRGYLGFAKRALHQNYFVVPVVVAFATGALAWHGPIIVLGAWIGTVYAWGTLVYFSKPLRGLGFGSQYLKYALAPTLIADALALSDRAQWGIVALTLAALALTIRQYSVVFQGLRRGGGLGAGQASAGFLDFLDRVKLDHEARIVVLPPQLCDLVAYRTRLPIYWGTHSDVFDDRLEAFFPVLRHDLSYYADDGGNRLLLDSRYCRPDELRLDPTDLLDSSGPFMLYRLRGGVPESAE